MTSVWIAQASRRPTSSTSSVAAWIARGGGIVDGLGGRRAGAPGDRGSGGERLEAALLAADAARDRRHRRWRGRSRRPGRGHRDGVDRRGRRRPRCRSRPRGRRGRWSSPTTPRSCRPMAAARTSFSMTTGRPSSSSSASRSAKSVQPRLTARVTWPRFGSTRPGTPTPTATRSSRRRPAAASASSRQAAMAGTAPPWSPTEEAWVARPRTAPSASTMSVAIFVPPISMPATGPGQVAVEADRGVEAVSIIGAPSARARGSAAARTRRGA